MISSVGRVQEEHQRLSTKVSSCVAGALVSLSSLPAKLNPLIRPLMDCVKTEDDPLMQVHNVCCCFCCFCLLLLFTLQQLAARWLSELMDICHSRSPSPNPKIIKNICALVCSDADHTPSVVPAAMPTAGNGEKSRRGQTPGSDEGGDKEAWRWDHGIISLTRLQQEVRSMYVCMCVCMLGCMCVCMHTG